MQSTVYHVGYIDNVIRTGSILGLYRDNRSGNDWIIGSWTATVLSMQCIQGLGIRV